MKRNSLFNIEPVNIERQPELDIAKGLAVFFMVAVHVLETFAKESIISGPIGVTVEILGGPPAAPVFMFLMGTGITYSRNNSPDVLLKRGLRIFFAGYLLNIAREVLPAAVYCLASGKGIDFDIVLRLFLTVDILQFAGLAFLLLAALQTFKNPTVPALSLSALIILLATVIPWPPIPRILPAGVCGLFWGASDTSYFPFLSWGVFPLSGVVFGHYLQRCNHKKALYGLLLPAGIIGCAAILFLSFRLKSDIGLNDEYSYYHQSLLGNMFNLSFIAFYLPTLYFLSLVIPPFVQKILNRWSRNVTIIYAVHWILIGWSTLFLGQNRYGRGVLGIIFIVLMVLSDLLSAYWTGYKKRKQQRTSSDQT